MSAEVDFSRCEFRLPLTFGNHRHWIPLSQIFPIPLSLYLSPPSPSLLTYKQSGISCYSKRISVPGELCFFFRLPKKKQLPEEQQHNQYSINSLATSCRISLELFIRLESSGVDFIMNFKLPSCIWKLIFVDLAREDMGAGE